MQIISYRTYSKMLSKEALEHVYNVMKDTVSKQYVVRLTTLVGAKGNASRYVLSVRATDWNSLNAELASLDFTNTLQPKDWDSVERDYNRWQSYSCSPNKKRVPENHIFDEDKSVKWNREQAAIHNQEVDEEVKEKNRTKNEMYQKLLQQIGVNIQYEMDCRINYDQAMLIWEYVRTHSSEQLFSRWREELSDFIELLNTLYGF